MNIKILKGTISWILIDNKTKTKLTNAFQNNLLTDIKLSKTQMSKITQSGGNLDSLLC